METNKKSPFTGGAVEICSEQATTVFRKERYSYTSYYYRCVDTGREFTDNELDDKSLAQVYSQYRQRHGIPSQQEIAEIRGQYGLSALAMSKILGLGDNQYRLYEDGTIPTESAGKLIYLAKQKVNMLALLDASKGMFTQKEYNRLCDSISNASVPIVFPYFGSMYYCQHYKEKSTGQVIAKKIVENTHYSKESYAAAANIQ